MSISEQVTNEAERPNVRAAIDLKKSLFIVASKSGETTETLSHFAYFWEQVSKVEKKSPGFHFAAITDPGTSLEKLARHLT